jgi:N6-L-threonylcarbamoyladenine synthase
MVQAISPPLTVLGIESSCDDTAAAVLRRTGGATQVLSSVIQGQASMHQAYGGIVPEIAARAHAERLDLSVASALGQSGVAIGDVDLVAVTAGPGLIGGLVAGVMTAKALAAVSGAALIGVNHLAGHALSPRIETDIDYPYLLLLVSGGHCQFRGCVRDRACARRVASDRD